jgi:transposase-like protein
VRHTSQWKELEVRKPRTYSEEFKRTAVERLKTCDSGVALAKELGVHRRMLYKWRDRLAPPDDRDGSCATTASLSPAIRDKLVQLERVLVDKTLEVDFFKGALHRVEARRQRSGRSGATVSTTKSKQ